MFMVKYLKSLLYILISIVLFSIIIATCSYFNIFSNTILNIFELLSITISMFIGGIYLGKSSNKKGYLEGLKIGFIVIFLLIGLNLLVYDKSFTLSSIMFYAIILVSTILGSIIGINKKGS